MSGETPDVGLTSGELGDLAAAYGWWKAHGDPEAFYDVLDAAVQRILEALAPTPPGRSGTADPGART